ncbi:hypothetical protein D3C87_175630 [compost metagenome]
MSFSRLFVLLFSLSTIFLAGCASGTFKARQEQREKLASSTGMFCEFISSDIFPDVDVELSMRMAKRCDADKNFSITNHKNESGQNGIVYCCAMASKAPRRVEAPRSSKPAPTATKDAPKDAEPLMIQDPSADVVAE